MTDGDGSLPGADRPHAIARLQGLGQSVWLDFIDERMLVSGEMQRRIEDEGVTGLTSNPTIFQKSIAASNVYDALVGSRPPSESESSVFEQLQVHSIIRACDLLRPVYDRTGGADGFASIEVAPQFAYDTSGSIEQARRLWAEVSRPNLMVKIPGTKPGLKAIEQCLSEGININITLLFSVHRYVEVVEAYLSALETRAQKWKTLDHVASVASFFVSRMDGKIDKMLDEHGGEERDALRGQIAIANAQVAYEQFEHLFATERFRRLASMGAHPQRVLWASTSTKDPAYPDTYYVEALVGPQTIDTMPLETLRAYLDHGDPDVRLTQDRAQARDRIAHLSSLGIDVERVAEQLETEGVRSFSKSFDEATAAIAAKRRSPTTHAGGP